MSDTDTDFLSIAANPYYAISFAPHVFIKHIKLGPTEDWVVVNASVIKDISSRNWLEELLDFLSLPAEDFDGHDIINPTFVTTISEKYSGKHEPLVTRDQWLQVNEKLISEIGPEAWLWQLLGVLNN
jgi:hypothetical protein